ncbi:MAG: HEAT repeat domain-containing protein [Cyanobacteria bacterium P01_D01_bin.73]
MTTPAPTFGRMTQPAGTPPDPNEMDALLERACDLLQTGEFDRGDRDLIGQMIEGLGDTRGMMRLQFAETLGKGVGEAAVPQLMEALASHENPVVRRASAKTLTLIRDPRAIPTLVNAFLNDEDTVVKGSSIGALADTGKPSVPVLLEILSDTNQPESIKGHAAWALGVIGSDAADELFKAAGSEMDDVRQAAVGAIAGIAREKKDERAIATLVAALDDGNTEVRLEAASALGEVQSAAARPKLLEHLADSDSDVRKGMALALMKVGDRDTVPILKEVLEKEVDPNIKRIMALAVSQLQNRLGITDLEED